MKYDRQDAAAGAFFSVVGISYGIIGWFSLPMGRAVNMGPGYFPMILSGLTAALGAVILFRSFASQHPEAFGVVPWRAILSITGSTVFFALTFRKLGMFPGVSLTALMASFASTEVSLPQAVLFSVAIGLFSTLVFSFGIGLQVPVIGPFFGS